MAELDLRQGTSNIYSNVEDSEALPLFVRFTNDDAEKQNKLGAITFDEIVSNLSGVHICSFIHRQHKGRNKIIDEIAIKVEGVDICVTAQLSQDECTLRFPHFTQKNMVLPEEDNQYVARKCEIRFVDYYYWCDKNRVSLKIIK